MFFDLIVLYRGGDFMEQRFINLENRIQRILVELQIFNRMVFQGISLVERQYFVQWYSWQEIRSSQFLSFSLILVFKWLFYFMGDMVDGKIGDVIILGFVMI